MDSTRGHEWNILTPESPNIGETNYIISQYLEFTLVAQKQLI